MSDTKERIRCSLCNAEVHSIQIHLKKDHPEVELDEYQLMFPDSPILSETAVKLIKESEARKAAARAEIAEAADTVVSVTKTPVVASKIPDGRRALHELFGLPLVAYDEAMPTKPGVTTNRRGEPIAVSVLTESDTPEFIPDVDPNYVFEVENLKNALMAIELDIPLYLWGHAGTGKTTLVEQINARTKRPTLRVQHTLNTEESHICGQWTARAGETIFELGPLPLAMKHGWTYLADEYDFGLPSVLAVYQPVLEGKPLVLKEADAANRIIRPHPNFRFVATGNTNGSGDETGLYQGVSIQNAANYDRFHTVLEIKYMKPELESQILVNQAKIAKKDADKLVDFANRVRESYDGNTISTPISPRTLIAASKIGLRKGSYRAGILLCFANKLTKIDKNVVDGLASRIFGT